MSNQNHAYVLPAGFMLAEYRIVTGAWGRAGLTWPTIGQLILFTQGC